MTGAALNLPIDRISVAPMMDWTDRHCRYFLRLLSPSARLYTEMVTAGAILNGDLERQLAFDSAEHPLALQLGGSEPEQLAAAVALAIPFGYDEINLNIGCPSDRVQTGRFGACLMADPGRVAACVTAMGEQSPVPVTVKTRIGIDDQDSYEFLQAFMAAVAEAGCKKFIVHARKAILAGLSPKENRSIPPLDYRRVYRVKRDFPGLQIVLNGGVEDEAAVRSHLAQVDGVMIGRRAYANPVLLGTLHESLMGNSANLRSQRPSRADVILKMAQYCEQAVTKGTRMHHITRHMLGLYAGQPGARAWRRFVSEASQLDAAGPELLIESLKVFDIAA